MSGIFSRFSWGTQTAPDRELQQLAHDQLSVKRPKVGPTIVTAVSGYVMDSATGGVVGKVVGGVGEAVVTPIVNAIKDAPVLNTIKETVSSATTGTAPIPGAEAVTQATSFLYDGLSGIASTAKLGWWAFKTFLPSSVQLGLGALGLYWAYSWWRQGSVGGSSQPVNFNINFHGGACPNPQVIKRGNDIEVTCLPNPSVNSPVTPPVTSAPSSPTPSPQEQWKETMKAVQEKVVVDKERMALRREQWKDVVRAVQDRIKAAAKLHESLQRYKDEQGKLLAPLAEKMDSILGRFQSIAGEKYAALGIVSLVTEARCLEKEIENTLSVKQIEVLAALREHGKSPVR
ncbi:MAG: hypothetical protein JSR46_07790 [Verrucomicrobia bacterium]|nr:hypothetical protein [Verrucomicrobiota bacterium]